MHRVLVSLIHSEFSKLAHDLISHITTLTRMNFSLLFLIPHTFGPGSYCTDVLRQTLGIRNSGVFVLIGSHFS